MLRHGYIKRVVKKMLVCICGVTVNLTATQCDRSRSINNSCHKQVISGEQLLVKTKSNLPSTYMVVFLFLENSMYSKIILRVLWNWVLGSDK